MKISKLISGLVVVALSFSSVIGVSTPKVYAATNEVKAVITKNNEHERIAESVEGQYRFIAVYNKDSKIVTITKKDVISDVILDINEINLGTSSEIVIQEENNFVTASASTYENTFSNYEFTKWYGSPNKWELRRPNGTLSTYYFRTYQTTRNGSLLELFKNTVYQINSLEGQYITLVGVQGLIGTLGVIFTGGLSVFLASSGFGVAAVNVANSLNTECKKALDYYHDIRNISTIIN